MVLSGYKQKRNWENYIRHSASWLTDVEEKETGIRNCNTSHKVVGESFSG